MTAISCDSKVPVLQAINVQRERRSISFLYTLYQVLKHKLKGITPVIRWLHANSRPPQLLIALRQFVLAVDKDNAPNSLGHKEGSAGVTLMKEIEKIVDARVQALSKKPGTGTVRSVTFEPRPSSGGPKKRPNKRRGMSRFCPTDPSNRQTSPIQQSTESISYWNQYCE